MYYFAYSPELDLPAYAKWARGNGLPWVEWSYLGAGMLREYDLAFARYDADSGGGLASLRPSVGKRVAGAVYEIPDAAIDGLERFASDVGNSSSWNLIRRVRRTGSAHRRTDNHRYDVVTFADPVDFRDYAPPTSEYLKSLITFATRLGHSHGWLMHLMTMQTADGELEPLYYDI
jgi:hypothetical protein